MSNKILTISVAAYNLGELIRKNIESFIKSKYKDNIELIVVDDGSIDNTSEIVEEYREKYPNVIKLIKKKNEGAGSTVNYGIINATGKYFKMVDGDDWVETDALDIIIDKLRNNNTDMVITNYEIFNNETKEIISIEKVKNINPNEIKNFCDVSKSISLAMHNIIIKTDILQKNKIKLDNGFYTDVEYILLPIPHVNSIIYYNLNLYVYMIAREGQSMSFLSLQKHIDMHDIVLKRMVNYYENNKKILKKNVRTFMKNKISVIATNQLQTILTFKDYKIKTKKVKQLNSFLKQNSKEIYYKYKYKSKKALLIIDTNYLLLNSISKKYLKKLTKEV